MAAQSPMPTVPNTPLSNRRTNDQDAETIDYTRLPTGACNFTNLNASGGGNAPRCGCKRYWDKTVGYGGGGVKSAVCMCEHHACFHDHGQGDTQSSRILSEVQLNSGASSTPKQPILEQALSRLSQIEGNSVLGENDNRPALQESALPDTFKWSRYIHPGSPELLPAIPSQCLLPSESGSSASSRYYRPFGGKGLHTLSHIPRPQAVEDSKPKPQPQVEHPRAMQVYHDFNGNTGLQSITEVATPSARLSQDNAEFRKNVAEVQQAIGKLDENNPKSMASFKVCVEDHSNHRNPIKQSNSCPGAESTTIKNDSDDNLIPRLRSILHRMASFPVTTENHERRLYVLENGSFTNPTVDDLRDDYTHMDIRIIEIEGRLDDVEKAQAILNDTSSVASRSYLGSIDSVDSRVSTTSPAMITTAIDRIDPSRIEALEAQLSELLALAPPSYSSPWEVEVVFIPFGSNLAGVWSSSHLMTQRSRDNSTTTDGWTQTQNNSLAGPQAQQSAYDQTTSWETAASGLAPDGDSWLVARACKPKSRVDERLRSRGLVKLVKVYGPDARDIQAAIMSAFGNIPSLLTDDPFTEHEDENGWVIPEQLSKYLGLQESWIPLRKIHKDSSLRFLSTSEMITPALWTYQFLASSVAMRGSGPRRLYVTQRDSYIQHHGDSAGWTWQKLRQLPRVYSDSTGSFSGTPEGDAYEPCWELDERLDPDPLAFNTSFESHVSSLSIRSIPFHQEPISPSDHFSSAAVSQDGSAAPTSMPAPRLISPLRERNPFRPFHARTLSMSSLIPPKSPSQPGKRRITSPESESQSSPSQATPAIILNLKRRRISRSPSRRRDTPGWSVGPPSPFPVAEELTEQNKRAVTPFAYATPHSNAPYFDTRTKSGADINVFHDDDDADELGSTTDGFNVKIEESGWEQNALSDYEPPSSEEASQDDQLNLANQLDDEWHGVDDGVGSESRIGGSFGLVDAKILRHGDDDDARSDASSQPSEYPSTHQGMFSCMQTGFKIHVDDEIDELD